MGKTTGFWKYWWQNIDPHKSAFSIVMIIVSAVLLVVGFLGRPLGLDVDPALESFFKALAVIILSLMCLLVKPWMRHLALENTIEELEENQKPKIYVRCHPDLAPCVAPVERAVYFRTIVTTLGVHKSITGAHGLLVKIEKDGIVLREHESDILPFTPGHLEGSTKKTLMPNVDNYLDVIFADFRAGARVCAASQGQPYQLLTKQKQLVFAVAGDYVLTVKVCADNTPTTQIRLLFKWKGDDTSTLELI